MLPELHRLSPGETVVPLEASDTRWAFDVYDIATKNMSSNYVEIVDGRGCMTSFPFRYVWPSELDLMAELAGLRLRERWSGWHREPFARHSQQHVSVWEKLAD